MNRCFRRLFAAGFFLFWFGFLAVAVWVCIRQRNVQMLLFSIPFWLVGIWMVRRQLGKEKPQKDLDVGNRGPVIAAAILVILVLAAGVLLLTLGLRSHRLELLLGGAFFLFGGFAFVLAALVLHGCFADCGANVLGVYMGGFLAVCGVGTVVLKLWETASWRQTLETFGVWILIPLGMTVCGVVAVMSSLRKK